MKKPFDFREMSTLPCTEPRCHNMIKKNVVFRKNKRPELCYRHYWLKRAKRGTSLGNKVFK